MDKGANEPQGIQAKLAWLPAKARELKQFFVEVRSELKKVTWPSRDEVQTTTIVVVGTSVFFGFYLWGLDVGFSKLLSIVLTK